MALRAAEAGGATAPATNPDRTAAARRTPVVAVDAPEEAPEEPSFDSMVEAHLYKEHRALERQGYTHGWGLQREPDPLLAPGIVLIPDFAFVRGDTRVFMEIAGFWTPTYRERKLSKLRALADAIEPSRRDAVSA